MDPATGTDRSDGARQRRWFRWSVQSLFFWVRFLGLLFSTIVARGPWELLPGAALVVFVIASLWLPPPTHTLTTQYQPMPTAWQTLYGTCKQLLTGLTGARRLAVGRMAGMSESKPTPRWVLWTIVIVCLAVGVAGSIYAVVSGRVIFR